MSDRTTVPAWAPTKVPPLRADVDRQSRELRQAMRRVMARQTVGLYIGLSMLLGYAAGAATAVYTCTGALA